MLNDAADCRVLFHGRRVLMLGGRYLLGKESIAMTWAVERQGMASHQTLSALTTSFGKFSVSFGARPHHHMRPSQTMKCDLQPVVRQIDGISAGPPRRNRSRQAGPAARSRLSTRTSRHPHGHAKTAERFRPRRTTIS